MRRPGGAGAKTGHNLADIELGAIQAALAEDPESNGDLALTEFLAARGFAYPARSATNVHLLAYQLPTERLAEILLAALASPAPDMAINNLERVTSVVGRDDLLAACGRKGQPGQLMTLLGSSPFLTNILCRDPAYFTDLFTSRLLETRRSEAEMLAALRQFVPAGTGRTVTLFNCFVMGAIPDSLDGIFEHLKEAALTMQQGGGVGMDFSTIRPSGRK